jgi:uncharacterized protein (DUF362 family)/NAD-dependent dihydropyrimidine dehydrogenase PreA subunit
MKQVYLKKCKNYDYELIYASIKEAVKALGGIEKYIKPEETVFIKANLLMAKVPEDAVTTHPIFIKALGNYLINENNNRVIVGDSPGGPFNKKALMKVYKTCGYMEAFKDTGIELNMNFESTSLSFDGKLLKNITLINGILEADCVISVAKLKTHGMMKYTGAVKNLFGTIPGVLKAEFHFRMPKVNDFANMLIDVCLASRPVLSFIDGIQGMEGAGPSGGDIVDSQIIIASDSPFHADRIAVDLIGMDYRTVPTVNESIKRDLTVEDKNTIQLLGDAFASIKIKEFISPKISKIDFINRILPDNIANKINNVIKPKPVFNLDRCIKCRVCHDNCPAKTINMPKGAYPKLIVDDCISCFCCQELCPENAIDIKRLWLLDKILKG